MIPDKDTLDRNTLTPEAQEMFDKVKSRLAEIRELMKDDTVEVIINVAVNFLVGRIIAYEMDTRMILTEIATTLHFAGASVLEEKVKES